MIRKINVLIIGTKGVGKSSILRKFAQVKSNAEIPKEKIVFVPSLDANVTFMMKESSAEGICKDIALIECEKSDAVILVFDITNQASYDFVESYFPKVKSKIVKGTKVALAANKADLCEDTVNIADARKLADKYEASFRLTSGAEEIKDTVIMEMFFELAKSSAVHVEGPIHGPTSPVVANSDSDQLKEYKKTIQSLIIANNELKVNLAKLSKDYEELVIIRSKEKAGMQGEIVECKEDIVRKTQVIEGLNDILNVLKEALAKKTIELEDLQAKYGKDGSKDGQDGYTHSKADGV